MATAHIRASAYASETLRRMAQASNTTTAAALDTILRERERYDFFASAAEAYGTLSNSERAEASADVTEWDGTLLDGLEETEA